MWCKSGRVMGITLALSRSFSGAAFDLHRTFYSSRQNRGKSISFKSSQLKSCPVQACQSYVVHRQSVGEHRTIKKGEPASSPQEALRVKVADQSQRHSLLIQDLQLFDTLQNRILRLQR